ncbi:hypothetical protein [Sphingomonas sp.]|uniref:hypothetical protein n=1 Tax=Sphingomonas sp. TaxID=28214 RepID=UPI003CC65FAF
MTMLSTGSAWTNRAVGSSAWIALIAAIDARVSCTFSSNPRPRAKGLRYAASPPPHAQKLISLTGV